MNEVMIINKFNNINRSDIDATHRKQTKLTALYTTRQMTTYDKF